MRTEPGCQMRQTGTTGSSRRLPAAPWTALWPMRLLAALCWLAIAGPVRAAEFSDVVQLVRERGWNANLGRLCEELELGTRAGDCVFRQVSVQETEGRGDPRAVNVRAGATPAGPQVVVFHLGPLVGEFFVMTAEGELLRAYYRAKGGGYERLPIEQVRDEFELDSAYWLTNLDRLRRGLGVVR